MVKGVSFFPHIHLMLERDCVTTMKGHFFGAFLRGRTFLFCEGEEMEIYRVSFIGHRELYNIRSIEDRIEGLVDELLRKKEYVEFYVGRNGDFDLCAASAIKRAQKDFGHHNSSLILVLPYCVKDEEYYKKFYDEVWRPIDGNTHFKAAIAKRNEWLIAHSDLLIAYVENESGEAYQTMKYAK